MNSNINNNICDKDNQRSIFCSPPITLQIVIVNQAFVQYFMTFISSISMIQYSVPLSKEQTFNNKL